MIAIDRLGAGTPGRSRLCGTRNHSAIPPHRLGLPRLIMRPVPSEQIAHPAAPHGGIGARQAHRLDDSFDLACGLGFGIVVGIHHNPPHSDAAMPSHNVAHIATIAATACKAGSGARSGVGMSRGCIRRPFLERGVCGQGAARQPATANRPANFLQTMSQP